MAQEEHKHPAILRYFDEIVPIEREAINGRRAAIRARRKDIDRGDIGGPRDLPGERPKSESKRDEVPAFPYPADDGPKEGDTDDVRKGGDRLPDPERTRPRPEPRDLTGLALSGGGIRSAAVCLGALQALDIHEAIDGIDYLSTVSGGGYIGASMTVAMSNPPGTPEFPFQRPNDPRDTTAVGHIRNYSNYLLPRATPGVWNISATAVILLRGMLANAVIVGATLLLFALLTIHAYPNYETLWKGSFIPRLFAFDTPPFLLTLVAITVLFALLIVWVLWRSVYIRYATYRVRDQRARLPDDRDAGSRLLAIAAWALIATVVCALLDLQPMLLVGLRKFYVWIDCAPAPQPGTAATIACAGILPKSFTATMTSLTAAVAAVTAFLSAVAALSGKLGLFLKTSEHASDWWTTTQRIASRVVIWLAAVVLPLLLLLAYLHLASWGIEDMDPVPRPLASIAQFYPSALVAAVVVGFWFKPNSYSLHQLYRDRLSKAFLFDPRAPDDRPSDDFKLSAIDSRQSPYHLINAAMNVQGSLAANQRGREADFFTFTRDFVGSDITLYASANERKPTYADCLDMEKAEPELDVATAMAISGAAFSANMGSSTIRPLSPTLALLNVRLGYWLRNPRDLAKRRQALRRLGDAVHLVLNKFYLLAEMGNFLDERSRRIYLSDGGHIENLGVYELLKRGCQLIIAVDAECDPALAFPSLIKMERYARIDLGIRIDLPWEEITAANRRYDRELADGTLSCPWNNGPHCAIGRILYHDGSEGILFYVKSSVTGDETDYVLDYKRRYPQFPHETTGDQFFSEEQFEAYRALGFHIVDRALDESDQVALAQSLKARGITQPMMMAWIRQMLGLPAATPPRAP